MADRSLHRTSQTTRHLLCALLSLLLIGIFPVRASHAWLIFHKPAYRGRIMDRETGKPLQGVVVVAIYRTFDAIGGPGGPMGRDIGAREALTDKNGMFTIPAYTAVMNPVAREEETKFIIFKAGYACWPRTEKKTVFPFDECRVDDSRTLYFPPQCRPHALFSKPIGHREEILKNPRTGEKITLTYGIVRLTKLHTLNERERASSIGESDFDLPIFFSKQSFDLPLLFQHVAEERCQLDLQRCMPKEETTSKECEMEYTSCMRHALRDHWWNEKRIPLDQMAVPREETMDAAVISTQVEHAPAPEVNVMSPHVRQRAVRRKTLGAEQQRAED